MILAGEIILRGWGSRRGRLLANCSDLRGLWTVGEQVVLLLSVVAIWNNYFLPLIIFSQNRLYPLTVGLGLWSQRAENSGNAQLFSMVVIGGLVTIVPLIALFLVLQRYWRGGLLLGSIAN
jgi:multiple sugar transport system permease protein